MWRPLQRTIRTLGFILLLQSLHLGTAFAQADRATVTGRVSDATGALLPGVSVIATDANTGATFGGATNDSGTYSISGLAIGDYRIKMSRPGFKDAQSSVHLVATQVQSLDVNMVVGPTDETVAVSAAPQLLELQTSSVANTLEEEAIRDLPLDATNGRDAVRLLVATTPSAAKSGISGNQVHSTLYLGGANSWKNTVYVDGVDAGAGPQGAIATPGLEAIQETQVQTTNADAELGAFWETRHTTTITDAGSRGCFREPFADEGVWLWPWGSFPGDAAG